MRQIAILGAFLVLSGCATEQKKMWVRNDGASADNPTLQAEFRGHGAQCRAEALTAAARIEQPRSTMSQTVIIERPRQQGEVDFITQNPAQVDWAALAYRRQQNQVAEAVFEGCMSQRGYSYVAVPSR